jgi:hypothetical protein
VDSFLQAPPITCIRLSPPHMCYMPNQSHSFRFYHPNNNGWAVQIINQAFETNTNTQKSPAVTQHTISHQSTKTVNLSLVRTGGNICNLE